MISDPNAAFSSPADHYLIVTRMHHDEQTTHARGKLPTVPEKSIMKFNFKRYLLNSSIGLINGSRKINHEVQF